MAPRKRNTDVLSPLKGEEAVSETVGVKGKSGKVRKTRDISGSADERGVASHATKKVTTAKKGKVANEATKKAPKTKADRGADFDPMAVSQTKAAKRKKQADLPFEEPDDKPKQVKYERRFAELARRMFLAKVSDDEIADFFGVEVEEMEWWKEEHPDFADAFRRDQKNYGRPSDWDERYLPIAKTLASLGATDLEIAQAFEVSIRTIYRWKLENVEFREALQMGKDQADAKVEDSLFKRATGYSFDSEKIVVVEGEPQRVEIIEHVPPDTKAAMWWLQNRRPGIWRDVRHIKHDVEPGGELSGWLNGLSGRTFAPKEESSAPAAPADAKAEHEKPRKTPRSIMPADDGDEDADG